MEVGDKVIFVGKDYNISKIFNYEEKFKGKEITEIGGLKVLKFKDIEGYYRASLFKKVV